MTRSRHINAPKHIWTDAERATLQAQYPHRKTSELAAELGVSLSVVYQQATSMRPRKSAEFYASDKSGRMLKGGRLSQETQFKPGQKPWNTGTHYVAGGRSHETRFKKGQLSGQAQHNWVPVGSYRVNADGVLDQKVTDLGRGPRDWEAVHRLIWKAANGPIPPGHIICFRLGRKTTVLAHITLDALECISRRELVARNSIWRKDPELVSLYLLKGAINRQVNRITKGGATP